MNPITIQKIDTAGQERFQVTSIVSNTDHRTLRLATAGTMLDRDIQVDVTAGQGVTHEKWVVAEADSVNYSSGIMTFVFNREISNIGAFILYAAGPYVSGDELVMTDKVVAVLSDANGTFQWSASQGDYLGAGSSVYATCSGRNVYVYGSDFHPSAVYHMIAIYGNSGNCAFHTTQVTTSEESASLVFPTPEGYGQRVAFLAVSSAPAFASQAHVGNATYIEDGGGARLCEAVEFYRDEAT